jgi:hypothetical protein
MLQENVGEKRAAAMDNMDRLGAVTAEFVSDMAIRWFQEAPGLVQEFFYVAKSGADNMAGAFSRLSNDGFVEYQSTGGTPARHGSGVNALSMQSFLHSSRI